MKKVLHSVRTGAVSVTEVPAPQPRAGGVLVRTEASAISPGTERAVLQFGRESLVGKARRRPDLVRQVLDKVKRDGLVDALHAAFGRLDHPASLGYSCAGRVVAVGSRVDDLRVGDRVACAGAGYATHAELNFVPSNLAVAVPRTPEGEPLAPTDACFATLGAVALHACRLAEPGLGDRVVVVGLGLIGLLAAQVLRASGCRVVGVELDPSRRRLAEELGVDEAVEPADAAAAVERLSPGLGADRVLIAAASDDSGPLELAASLARDRARVVALGDTGLEVPRRTFYDKELTLTVSRSYGPGRYDPDFEEKGMAYPPGYVRWTERENMRAFLELVAAGKVSVSPLVSHHFEIAEAEEAYQALEQESPLSVVLLYPDPRPTASDGGETVLSAGRLGPEIVTVSGREPGARGPAGGKIGVSFLGAGNFARNVLLPHFERFDGVNLRGVVTAGGISARAVAERHGFEFCATDPEAVWEDEDTAAVIVALPHDLHHRAVLRALESGKAVFVEKPLCIHREELAELVEAFEAACRSRPAPPLVTVGFNRRRSPLISSVREFLDGLPGPKQLLYRINAGPLPAAGWVADSDRSGGRIVGEGCHFVDLALHLLGTNPVAVSAHQTTVSRDDAVFTVELRDGSLATFSYCVGGDRSYSKERIEILGGDGTAVIDDFRRGRLVRDGRSRRLGGLWGRKRKGFSGMLEDFLRAVRGAGANPVPFAEAVAVTRLTFAVVEALSSGRRVLLPSEPETDGRST